MNAKQARELTEKGGVDSITEHTRREIYYQIEQRAKQGYSNAFFYPEGGFNDACGRMLRNDGYTVSSANDRNETTYTVSW